MPNALELSCNCIEDHLQYTYKCPRTLLDLYRGPSTVHVQMPKNPLGVVSRTTYSTLTNAQEPSRIYIEDHLQYTYKCPRTLWELYRGPPTVHLQMPKNPLGVVSRATYSTLTNAQEPSWICIEDHLQYTYKCPRTLSELYRGPPTVHLQMPKNHLGFVSRTTYSAHTNAQEPSGSCTEDHVQYT